MKAETAMNRILNSDASDKVKMLKLYGLALKQIPGSKLQEMVIAQWEIYRSKVCG